MGDRTDLGDRMKRYEEPYRHTLPRRVYTVTRVDGRAFHSYLRGCERPYDTVFMAQMDEVAQALCKEISGARFAYVQSDEISVLSTDFGSHGTEPWFGGDLAKHLSLAAAVASATLTRLRPVTAQGSPIATFDARVFTLADPVEVANYFLWRQKDAVRNSISMTAQTHFSPRRLHGVNTDQMQEMLWHEARVNWNDQPDGFKRGRVVFREVYVEQEAQVAESTPKVRLVRSRWVAKDAPHFAAEPGNWLASMVPPLPSLWVQP